MARSYVNRRGVTYHLPDFGPPAYWPRIVVTDGGEPTLPVLSYYECDAGYLCSRALDIWADGRFRLAFPGGLDGDCLPEGPLPPSADLDASGALLGEMTRQEFETLWATFSLCSSRPMA